MFNEYPQGPGDRQIFTPAEVAIGMAEAQLAGMVEYGDEDHFKLSQRGLDRALELASQLGVKDMIVLMYFIHLLDECKLEDEERGDDPA